MTADVVKFPKASVSSRRRAFAIGVLLPLLGGPAAAQQSLIYSAGNGTKIGTITSYASLPGCQTYDVAFWNGLTIVTATAAPDITVSFR